MVAPERSRSGESDDVTASEAASYAFCAKAWHLEQVLGQAPSPHAAERRARGVRQHEQHGQAVAAQPQRSPSRCAIVLLLLFLAALLSIVLLMRCA